MCETHKHSGSRKNARMPSQEQTVSSGGAAVAELEPPPSLKGEDWRAQGRAEYESPDTGEVIEAEVVERAAQPVDRHSRSKKEAPMPSAKKEQPVETARPQIKEEPKRALPEQPKAAEPQAKAEEKTAPPTAAAQPQRDHRSKKQRRKDRAKRRRQHASAGVSAGFEKIQQERSGKPTDPVTVKVMEILNRAAAEEDQHPRNTKGQKKAFKAWEASVMIDLREALTGETLRPAQFKDAGRAQIRMALEADIKAKLGNDISGLTIPKFMKM